MRVLLTPLYFCKGFCKHCLRIFKREHPDEWVWGHELRRMPPLGSFDPDRGFVVVPGEARERMRSGESAPWMGEWPDVLDALEAEGALATIDIDQELTGVSHARGGMLRQDMQNPEKWASAMSHHDALMSAADSALSGRLDATTYSRPAPLIAAMILRTTPTMICTMWLWPTCDLSSRRSTLAWQSPPSLTWLLCSGRHMQSSCV